MSELVVARDVRIPFYSMDSKMLFPLNAKKCRLNLQVVQRRLTAASPALLLALLGSSIQIDAGAIAASGAGAFYTTSPVVEVVFAGLDVLVYPLCDFQKGPLYTLSTLGRCLDVLHDAVGLAPFFGLFT